MEPRLADYRPTDQDRAEFAAWLDEPRDTLPLPVPPEERPARPRPPVRRERTTEERLTQIETIAQADAHAWAELLADLERDRNRARRHAKRQAKLAAALAAEVTSLAADLSALCRALRPESPRVVATADACGEVALSLAGDC